MKLISKLFNLGEKTNQTTKAASTTANTAANTAASVVAKSLVSISNVDKFEGSVASAPKALSHEAQYANAVRQLNQHFDLLDTAAGKGKADGKISEKDLKAALNNPALPQELREACRFLLDNKADFKKLDLGAGKGWSDGIISKKDVAAVLAKLPSAPQEMTSSELAYQKNFANAVNQLDKHFDVLDTAAKGGKADGKISEKDLAAAMNNPSLPPELREACRFLLENKASFNQLDVAAGKGGCDGIISKQDVAAALKRIASTATPAVATQDSIEEAKLQAQAAENRAKLTNAPGFQQLNASQQQQALQAFNVDPTSVSSTNKLISLLNGLKPEERTSTLNNLNALLGSQGFQSLSAGEKALALDVFNATDATGRNELVTLANRQINGKSALLDVDKDGNSLLRNLHGLSTQKLNAEFGNVSFSRAQLIGSIIQEAAKPGEVNQGSHGTCTVTSMQYMLCTQNPAEYVRIMQGITSASGKVTLRGGDILELNPGCVGEDSNKKRSHSERIFQASMMDFCNGADAYNNQQDKNTWSFLFVSHSYGGLHTGQEKKGLEALFGQGFKVETKNVVGLLTERSQQGKPTYIDMHWGENQSGGHAVVVTEVKDGRVYIRNPWGSYAPNGSTQTNPPRRIEDRALGLESMSIADFEKWVMGCYLPSSA